MIDKNYTEGLCGNWVHDPGNKDCGVGKFVEATKHLGLWVKFVNARWVLDPPQNECDGKCCTTYSERVQQAIAGIPKFSSLVPSTTQSRQSSL